MKWRYFKDEKPEITEDETSKDMLVLGDTGEYEILYLKRNGTVICPSDPYNSESEVELGNSGNWKWVYIDEIIEHINNSTE